MSKRSTTRKWLKPPGGSAKINLYVQQSVGMTKDFFFGASVICYEGLTNPKILEASPCCEALSLACDLNLY